MTTHDDDLTAQYYRRHHAGETGFMRYGFTFGDEQRKNWFSSRIGTGKSVLDIGCRDGTLTSAYLAGNKVSGIDIDSRALELAAKNHGIEGVVVNLNREPLPFADQAFDVVVAGEVIEHLQFPDAVITEIGRVLRPGGLFLGSVPNSFRLQNRLMFLRGQDFETDPTHLHHFSPKSLRDLMRGFTSVRLDYLGGRWRRVHPRLLSSVIAWEAHR